MSRADPTIINLIAVRDLKKGDEIFLAYSGERVSIARALSMSFVCSTGVSLSSLVAVVAEFPIANTQLLVQYGFALHRNGVFYLHVAFVVVVFSELCAVQTGSGSLVVLIVSCSCRVRRRRSRHWVGARRTRSFMEHSQIHH